MAKVTNVMATEMALDVMKASTDLKALTQVVSANQSAWKAQTAALKSAGDYVGAYEAKVEGLGGSIEAQQDKLDALKDKQSDLGLETSKDAQKFVELKDKIDELKSAQFEVDDSTDDGKTKFKELGTQISELTEQQDKLSPATVKLAEDYEKYQRQINQTEAQIVSLEAQQDRAKESLDYQKSGLVEVQQAYENNNKVMQAHVERLKAEGNEDEANRTKLSGLTEGLSKLNEKYDLQVAELEKLESAQNRDNEAIATQRVRVDETATAIAKATSESKELQESLNKEPPSLFKKLISQMVDLDAQEEKTKEHFSEFGERVKSIVSGAAIYQGLQTIGYSLKGIAESGYEAAEAATNMKERMEGVGLSDKDIESLTDQIKELKENTNMSADSVNKLQMRFYDNTHSISAAKQLTQGVASLEDQLKLSSSASDSFSTALNRIESSGTVTLSSLGRLEKSAPGFSTAFQKASGMSTQAFDNLVNSGKMTSTQFNAILAKASSSYKQNSDTFNSTSEGALHKLQQTWADTKQRLMTPLIEMSATGLTALDKSLNNPATKKAVDALGQSIAGLTAKLTTAINYVVQHESAITSITGSIVSIAKTIGGTIWSMFAGTVEAIANAFGGVNSKSKAAKDPLDKLAAAFKELASHKTAISDLTKIIVTGLVSTKVIGGVASLVSNIKVLTTTFKNLEIATKLQTAAQKALDIVMDANPIGIVAVAAIALVTMFTVLYNRSKTFRDAMNKLGSTLKSVFTGAIKWIADWGKNFKKGWDDAKSATSKGVKDVGNFFGNLTKDAGKHLSDLWSGTKSTFKTGWSAVTSASSTGAKDVGNWFSNMSNDTRKKAIQMFNEHKQTFRDGYNVLQDETQTWHDVMTGKWSKVGSDIGNTAKDMSKTAKSIFSDMYNKLNDMTGGRLGDMVNAWKSKMSAIGNTVSDAKASIHKHFVDLVRGIVKPFNDMLSGLEKGINWVLDKVGASKISGDWSVPMPSYAQGTKDTHQGGLAKVNDGQGANYREMYHLPNGQIGMFPAVKNMIVPLPKGTSVLNGDSSAQLAKMMGIPGYASGVGDFFSGLWNGAKDVLDDTEDILKKSAEFMESLFKHFMGGTSSKVSLANDILTHFPKTLANDAVKWVKKMFNTLNNTLDSNASGPKATGDHLHWLKQAGVPDSWTSSMSWLINAESGWNPHARNGSSGAYGIPQSLPASKLASAGKDWKDNPITQIKWMVNYIKGRYGTAMAAESFHKRVGWYANGGIATTPSIFGEAGAEMAIPLNTMSSSRAWKLLGQVVDYYRGGTNSTNVTTNNADVVAELKSVKSYLAALVGLGTDQITATKGIGTFDQKAQLKYEAQELSKQSWTTI